MRSRTKQGHLPPGRAGQEPRPPDRARRAPQRLPRVGVLLRLRHRLAAVGERDDAGDRDPGALARLPGARQGALAAQRAARARRVRAGAADRRLGARARRPPLRPVLLRAVAPRVQRRPAGRDRPARRRRAAALRPRASGCSSAASAAARREIADFDTGAWSLYSEHGAEATLNYHSLIAGFLDEPLRPRPQAHVLQRRQALRALRARADEDRDHAAAQGPLGPHEHGALLDLEDLDRQGARVGHARAEPLARPQAVARQPPVAWRPPGRGRYRLRIEAQGPSGPLGVETRSIRVTTPKPKPKPKKKKPAPRSRRGDRDRGADDAASGRKP